MRDIDVRRRLLADERLHSGEPGTLVIEELGLCQGTARVDIAVVNGTLHGYEIKSERDTLERLPGQIDVYNRTLELVTIVSAPRHVLKIKRIVPHWWGIWTVEEEQDPRKVRNPLRNPGVAPFALAQLLWRDEALQVLTDLGCAAGLRSKPRRDLWQTLASQLPIEELGKIVRGRLKQRGASWRVLPPTM